MFYVVYASLIASLIFVIVKLIISPIQGDDYERVKSDYLLTLLQCIAALLVMHIPIILEVRFQLDVPSGMTILFIVFLYAAVYLGEFRSFYYKFAHWDTILHAISGFMAGAASFSLISYLANSEIIKLRPSLVAVFAFCFAVTIGALWEIYEFAWDSLANLNMQKYADELGNVYSGRVALADTMLDIIVDTIGAAVISIIGYISIKFDKRWIEKLIVKKQSSKVPDVSTDLVATEGTPVEISAEAAVSAETPSEESSFLGENTPAETNSVEEESSAEKLS